jgi:hypothetical protein
MEPKRQLRSFTLFAPAEESSVQDEAHSGPAKASPHVLIGLTKAQMGAKWGIAEEHLPHGARDTDNCSTGTNPSWQPLDLGPMLDEYQAGAEAGKAVPAWVKAMTKLKGER